MGAGIYIVVMGFNSVALAAITISVAGAAAPLVRSDEGIWDVVVGTFEAMTDGVVAVVEGIASAIASLFS